VAASMAAVVAMLSPKESWPSMGEAAMAPWGPIQKEIFWLVKLLENWLEISFGFYDMC